MIFYFPKLRKADKKGMVFCLSCFIEKVKAMSVVEVLLRKNSKLHLRYLKDVLSLDAVNVRYLKNHSSSVKMEHGYLHVTIQGLRILLRNTKDLLATGLQRR